MYNYITRINIGSIQEIDLLLKILSLVKYRKMILDENLLTTFEQYLQNKNRKKDSVSRNLQALREFTKVLEIKNTDEISLVSIENYKTYLSQKKTPKTSIYY